MRKEELMVNADPETIAVSKRTSIYKAVGVMTLVFSLAAVAVTASDRSKSDTSTGQPAVVQPAPASPRDSEGARGRELYDEPTRGVDMHG